MKKLLMFAVAFLFVVGLSTTAKAVVLPFEGVGPDSLVVSLNSGTPTPFIGTPSSFTGTLDETVYSDPTGYLFEYQVYNSTPTAVKDNINIVTAFDFTNFSTVLGQVDLGGDTPSTFSFNGGNGDVNFIFQSGLAPGQTSDVLLIQTDAPSTNAGYTLIQDHGQAQVVTYGPAPIGGSSTPEPATMAMFAMGTLGLFGLRKRQIA